MDSYSCLSPSLCPVTWCLHHPSKCSGRQNMGLICTAFFLSSSTYGLCSCREIQNLTTTHSPSDAPSASHSHLSPGSLPQTPPGFCLCPGSLIVCLQQVSQVAPSKKKTRNSLGVQWLGFSSFTARAGVQSGVGELRFCKPHGVTKRKKKNQVVSSPCLKFFSRSPPIQNTITTFQKLYIYIYIPAHTYSFLKKL